LAVLTAAGLVLGQAGAARVLARAAGTQQALVFRAQTDLVTVDVSVWSDGRPVRGLTANDFTVKDGGVLQSLHSAAVEAVPIDVTLFIDTSDSMSDLRLGLERDVQAILGRLRPFDRLRVLTLGYEVLEWIGWRSPGTAASFALPPVGRVSAIYDALWLAMMRRPDTGRRHLVVAMTDGDDWSSVLSSASLLEAAGRSESVLHVVRLLSAAVASRRPGQWSAIRPDLRGQKNLQEAAARTGGRVHEASAAGRQVMSAFERAFDDFRQGYVLSYAYEGAPIDGWHDIDVAVNRPGSYSVRARRGYFARP
jgi:VWFA-related protein